VEDKPNKKNIPVDLDTYFEGVNIGIALAYVYIDDGNLFRYDPENLWFPNKLCLFDLILNPPRCQTNFVCSETEGFQQCKSDKIIYPSAYALEK